MIDERNDESLMKSDFQLIYVHKAGSWGLQTSDHGRRFAIRD
ncbi:hypothetical protein RBWH47_05833 [Rhodopirellula baltica WH47]|uniref:Uncharacterized protein n=1 Tax=Rhodopirellula baltica WH47 TaxID=991778 RepID=F2AW40_RHOBT|nr:hypothetical protein RBWH47_05833 [Rhodopirellula baltica WH47]